MSKDRYPVKERKHGNVAAQIRDARRAAEGTVRETGHGVLKRVVVKPPEKK